jgi:hypothetical protein
LEKHWENRSPFDFPEKVYHRIPAYLSLLRTPGTFNVEPRKFVTYYPFGGYLIPVVPGLRTVSSEGIFQPAPAPGKGDEIERSPQPPSMPKLAIPEKQNRSTQTPVTVSLFPIQSRILTVAAPH